MFGVTLFIVVNSFLLFPFHFLMKVIVHWSLSMDTYTSLPSPSHWNCFLADLQIVKVSSLKLIWHPSFTYERHSTCEVWIPWKHLLFVVMVVLRSLPPPVCFKCHKISAIRLCEMWENSGSLLCNWNSVLSVDDASSLKEVQSSVIAHCHCYGQTDV